MNVSESQVCLRLQIIITLSDQSDGEPENGIDNVLTLAQQSACCSNLGFNGAP